MDKRVEIHGTSRADINGKRGVATDFHWHEDEKKWAYTVQLDSGESFKLRLANVRADSMGVGASSAGEAKRVQAKQGRARKLGGPSWHG